MLNPRYNQIHKDDILKSFYVPYRNRPTTAENASDFYLNMTYKDVQDIFKNMDFQKIINGSVYDIFFKLDSYKLHKPFNWCSSTNEILEFLEHGWDTGTIELIKGVKSQIRSLQGYKVKTTYDVVGSTPSVPRYLQGIPTNMINNKMIKSDDKVINVIKDFTYSVRDSAEKIMNETVKTLAVVKYFENKGFRINLYVGMFSLYENSCSRFEKTTSESCNIIIKIKDAKQPINYKKVAFPLAHVDFFRVIMLRLQEMRTDLKVYKEHRGYPIINVVKNDIKAVEKYIENTFYSFDFKKDIFIPNHMGDVKTFLESLGR